MDIVLASASPRRRELMRYITDNFTVVTSTVDESIVTEQSADKLVERLAVLKAEEVAKHYPNSVVIGADTVVVCDDTVLGKPTDKADATRQLRMLSGRAHRVLTAVALCYSGNTESYVSESFVEFYPLSDSEIDRYIDSGEPMDKAGSYGIQGKGALFIKRIEGDFYSVMGLPLSFVNRRLKQLFLAF